MSPTSHDHAIEPRRSRHFARGRRNLLLLAIGTLCLASQLPSRAEDHIWTALLLATNEKKAVGENDDLKVIRSQVRAAFGYQDVKLIGAAIKSMDDRFERWLVPSQHFWLSVKSKGESDGSKYQLALEMWHDRRRLLESDVVLGPESPLFIRGPMHARGQLIIVLKVLPDRGKRPVETTVVKGAGGQKGQAVQVKGE